MSTGATGRLLRHDRPDLPDLFWNRLGVRKPSTESVVRRGRLSVWGGDTARGSARRNVPTSEQPALLVVTPATEEDTMGFGRGALLWLLGIPLPIILLLALFWHH
jgi:hypothetical protein